MTMNVYHVQGLNGGTAQERRSITECTSLINGRLDERKQRELTLRYQQELVYSVTSGAISCSFTLFFINSRVTRAPFTVLFYCYA